MASARLVVIDDEIEFTKALNQFFSSRGYEVHVAFTGDRGLELVRQLSPDVVLMDLKMPGMDGDEVLRSLQQSHPSLKVILITAYKDAGRTREHLLSLGAYAHFEKPLASLRELAEVVKRAVGEERGP